MNTDTLEALRLGMLIDLSIQESMVPPCDYGGWDRECPHAAIWIMHHKTKLTACCGEPAKPFRLLCQKCLDDILTAPAFTCVQCGHVTPGEKHRQAAIGKIERL